MKVLPMLLLIALAVVSCSGAHIGIPEARPVALLCPPGAQCQPATHPPKRVERSMHPDQHHAPPGDEMMKIDKSNIEDRRKKGFKGVPIIACNRKTGKCIMF